MVGSFSPIKRIDMLELTKKERIDLIMKQTVWTHPIPYNGGQTVGMPPSTVTLTHKDLDISITIGCQRSMLKNKELAYTLFELTLMEIV